MAIFQKIFLNIPYEYYRFPGIKISNEELIKYGFPVDIWFHVDNLSSAHVYLRLAEGYTIDTIPKETLEECLQLVKENSIEGCKKERVSIVYTPWENLLKKSTNITPEYQ